MEVILREDIDKLGNRGDVVKVAPGSQLFDIFSENDFHRDFLLP